ncbi:MAG: hypothetical protein IPO07_15140 [Haliscomenobacter sp.]|nr:hypothetical protein [Haliscomenobacter sp.]MBK9489952.1 hypothetical protein [Haliscomenobacter sp.]
MEPYMRNFPATHLSRSNPGLYHRFLTTTRTTQFEFLYLSLKVRTITLYYLQYHNWAIITEPSPGNCKMALIELATKSSKWLGLSAVR